MQGRLYSYYDIAIELGGVELARIAYAVRKTVGSTQLCSAARRGCHLDSVDIHAVRWLSCRQPDDLLRDSQSITIKSNDKRSEQVSL